MGPDRVPVMASLAGTPYRFAAPARVNLIGEHTDYTGGFVLPMAIPFRTVASITSDRDLNQYAFVSELYPTVRHMELADRSGAIKDWTDYPVGVLRELQKLGVELPPFTIAFAGDVPIGSGLSSSASIEVATAVALLAISGKNLPTEEIALLCQRAENLYVHSPCGIMDQFVIAGARAEHALLLNTRDLTYEHLSMNAGRLADCRIVVANSMVKHSIAGGDYGLRRREVESGQAILREIFPQLRDLGDANLTQLASCETAMSRQSFKRCRHIISENSRVAEARAAIIAGDPEQMGGAMTRSHASQRDDFECSVEEIDFLVETALNLSGCYGSRLTGGGFGGCTVSLVESSKSEHFSRDLKSTYRRRFGIEAETYLCDAVDGAVEHLATADYKPEKPNE